jgi:hypothetical protein
MDKTCRNNCLYFSFTDDAGHYGITGFVRPTASRSKMPMGFVIST